MSKRYENIIKAALQLQQLQKETEKLIDILSDNLSVSELRGNAFSETFDPIKSKEALVKCRDERVLTIEGSKRDKKVLKYKDVSIDLWESCIDKGEDYTDNAHRTLRLIMKDINKQRIIGNI